MIVYQILQKNEDKTYTFAVEHDAFCVCKITNRT